MKLIAGNLLVLLVALQYKLWIAPDGLREVWRIEHEIREQQAENRQLEERNRTLAAEVQDLKKGRTALEERARTDLGMIGGDETFFQVGPRASGPAERSTTGSASPDDASRVRAAAR